MGVEMERPSNQILAIFGASGDLAKRKLMPSLFGLFSRGFMPEKFAVVGVSRTKFDDESFRKYAGENIKTFLKGKELNAEMLESFLSRVFYLCIDTCNENSYLQLRGKFIDVREKTGVADNILFDLATPPDMYSIIPRALKNAGLNKSQEGGFRRIIVEKPFGSDLESSQNINSELLKIFEENEILRIDHYLGKETVQNILVLRFANGIFESLWNRNFIDSVEIRASETLGVENRGGYYDGAGALRDMVQNHLLQLMAFVAMEAPATFDSESIRDEIAKVLRSLKPFSDSDIRKNAIRAQYSGYAQEKGVAKNSSTETYAALKLFIENWRWGGVPFYIITGKEMPEKTSEILIRFKAPPQKLFKGQCCGSSCNSLAIRIYPDESISLMFGLKVPGAGFEVRQVDMDFDYKSISPTRLPDAYERLLLDAMLGDNTLFARNDSQSYSWKFVEPILNYWRREGRKNLHIYEKGTLPPVFEELRESNLCKINPVHIESGK
ncbi:MAG: glucose-6-phosphate dehydrogenase [Opitutales bacterium]|nr:glucose-6-phosphate dehydrogenase [Opitutales bacterium]